MKRINKRGVESGSNAGLIAGIIIVIVVMVLVIAGASGSLSNLFARLGNWGGGDANSLTNTAQYCSTACSNPSDNTGFCGQGRKVTGLNMEQVNSLVKTDAPRIDSETRFDKEVTINLNTAEPIRTAKVEFSKNKYSVDGVTCSDLKTAKLIALNCDISC